jgi:hypothetical protein
MPVFSITIITTSTAITDKSNANQFRNAALTGQHFFVRYAQSHGGPLISGSARSAKALSEAVGKAVVALERRSLNKSE